MPAPQNASARRKAHILLVGGSKGLGRAAAVAFTSAPVNVSIIARRLPSRQVSEKSRAQYWQADVLDGPSVKRALLAASAQFGAMQGVVFFQRYRGAPEDSWAAELETGLLATRNIIEMLVRDFHLRNCSIVIVSSINAQLISKHVSLAYHIVKAALNQLVKYYAVTLGKKGIRINSVSPGTFLKTETRDYHLKNKRQMKLWKALSPLGRVCTAKEVVEPITFLCSSASSFITGQDLVVDGGISLQYQESLDFEL
jgi:NAD(P)-dependent dehydrogenase (short-subunit alcohol dehydrogenase family)